MVQKICPEVVAHLDLIRPRRIGWALWSRSPRLAVQREVGALEVIREVGSLVEINTAGWRKGLPTPYPDSWIVAMGARMGIPFCIGDDSHNTRQVGFGLEEGAPTCFKTAFEVHSSPPRGRLCVRAHRWSEVMLARETFGVLPDGRGGGVYPRQPESGACA